MEQKDAWNAVSKGNLSPQELRKWMYWRWLEVGWGVVGAGCFVLSYFYKFNESVRMLAWGVWLLISVLLSMRQTALWRRVEKQKHV